MKRNQYETKWRLLQLELEVAELRRKIQALEDSNVLKPRYSPMPYTAPDLFIKQDSCPVCGLKFDGPMSYACNNPKCPTGIMC